MRQRKEVGIVGKVAKTICFTILILYAASMLIVLGWGLMTSFKSGLDFMVESKLAFPNREYSLEEMKFSNYKVVFETMIIDGETSFYKGNKEVVHAYNNNIFDMFFNSLWLSLVGALLKTLVPAVVAYLCARFDYKISKIVYILVVFAMTIPVFGTAVPMMALMRNTGLYDTPLGYICQNFTFGGMYFLVLHGTFVSFSNAYVEAAEIDGANQYRILFQIAFPLVLPVLGSIFLIQFVTLWDSYQNAMLWMPSYSTLAYGIWDYNFNGSTTATAPQKIASCMVLAIPVLVLFIIFKDKIMGNMTVGGVKG